ncbi:peptidylprolyl isomerase [Psychrobium sp. 1_MG-2023]|uniref:peptidylprolyl isomerase n=1 Tax=Psychrobium sp. 1_MG-2023 TaxID=3062624 RepID=UPI000C338B84|nr:peptidylprolyl isomerase [Psychrobium sp. 1_MG-2023]MDP2562464.1 peptidylprolyl isomerase [Psychrobium sp. 1_MG-2023]PKF54298.1 peptidylprolyl isomerase [Alteromonadales bacterium alter-6D02]
MKKIITSTGLLSLLFTAAPFTSAEAKVRGPSEIIANAPESAWRELNLQQTLYIELEQGRVVVELNSALAPNHVKQLTKLAQENFYDGLNFYRYVEGFVAQAGDMAKTKAVKHAKPSIKSERIYYTDTPLDVTYLPHGDGYAANTGFYQSFPIASNQQKNQFWQPHCQGAFAMARSNDPHSGGTEFYITIGQAPRYLDKNLTVFGQVRSGMQYLHQLQRQPVTNKDTKQYDNPIKTISVASDVPKDQQSALQVMKTSSASFKELVQSRMNRPEAFFIERPNYVDVCGVTVPTRTR